jgi:thiol-disulfide isomerase/thioredoxin
VIGLIVVLAALGVVGVVRTAPRVDASVAEVVSELGGRATLVQFSSAFCAPCRATRVLLADLADGTPGVVHVDVDAESHLELVRTLRILKTPTTLVLDRTGAVVGRASGVPRRDEVLAVLDRLPS